MLRNYFRVLLRVVFLAVLVSAVAMLSRPQVALAGESCFQCLQSCEAECTSMGLQRCPQICEQFCIQEGFCK